MGHGIMSYKKTLKKGTKGTTTGLIQFMLKEGTYNQSDILAAANEAYPSTSANKIMNWYKKQFGVTPPKTSGKSGGSSPTIAAPVNPPPVSALAAAFAANQAAMSANNAQVAAGMASPPAPAPSAPPPAPTPPAAVPTPPSPAPGSSTGAFDPSATKNALMPKSSPEMWAELAPVFQHLDKLTPENKPLVEAKLAELASVLESGDPKSGLAAMQHISASSGMSVNAVNSAIEEAQYHYGNKVKPQAYAPSTKAQKAVYSKLAAAPHYKQEHINYFEDHQGKEIKTSLKTDTKKIPADHYAKVSSAYGSNRHNGDTPQVHAAMDAYKNATQHIYTPDEAAALQQYKGHLYWITNKVLLGEENSPEVKQRGYGPSDIAAAKVRIEHCKTGIDKSVVPADTPSFRGLGVPLQAVTGFGIEEDAIGRCFTHANIASTSRDIGVSKCFGSTTMLKFTIPAGAKGMVLGSQGVEKETILPANCAFRIDKIEKGAMGCGHLVHCTYLGEQENAAPP
jgi:hypothetical protein